MTLFALSTEADLNRFISANIQPTDDYLARCGQVIDRLVMFLQNSVPDQLRPRRVIKGGSLGKGTVVVGKSDIDLTVMLARYSTVRSLVSHMQGLLDVLAQYLRGYQGVTVKNTNPYCVQIEVMCHGGHVHPADILLAVDVLEIEQSRERVYDKMGGEDRAIMEYYSPSFVPLMVDMFATLPTKLKSLIRLVKYWKGLVCTDPRIEWPKSYGFEMVTVYAWMRAGEPTVFDMTRALHAVLTCLVKHRDLRANFGTRAYYDRRYLRPQGGPYIMDPLDPYDNLYSCKGWNWGETASKAREWLQMPLFEGVVIDTERIWRLGPLIYHEVIKS